MTDLDVNDDGIPDAIFITSNCFLPEKHQPHTYEAALGWRRCTGYPRNQQEKPCADESSPPS